MIKLDELFFLKGIFTFIVGGGLAAVIRATYKLYKLRVESKKHSAERAIKGVVKVYETMKNTMAEADCSRVLIIQLNNGGGIPRVGKNVYSSILYDVCANGLNRVKESWQNQIIDDVYAERIHELMKKKCILVDVPSLEDSDLKRAYTRLHIRKSVAREVLIEKERYVYMIMTYEHDHVDFDVQGDLARDCAARIARIFNGDY